jgi:hypothetical protein
MDLSTLPVKQGFRLRGESVSRLETLVDAAFAFSLSMLVISIGAMPKDVDEMFAALHRVPTFAASFFIIVMFWYGHYRWSRRYGIEDGRTTLLSLVFVFVMLIYVYPLRMIMSGAMYFMTGGWVPQEMMPEGVASRFDMQDCFIVYGAGFAALSAILYGLNRHALRQANELELDALERHLTREEAGGALIWTGVGCLSIVLALCLHGTRNMVLGTLPGFSYGLLGVFGGIHRRRMDRQRSALFASSAIVRNGRALTQADLR